MPFTFAYAISVKTSHAGGSHRCGRSRFGHLRLVAVQHPVPHMPAAAVDNRLETFDDGSRFGQSASAGQEGGEVEGGWGGRVHEAGVGNDVDGSAQRRLRFRVTVLGGSNRAEMHVDLGTGREVIRPQ